MRLLKWLRALWCDEQGDLIQNLGWIVAVSLGVIAIGTIIYLAIQALATKIQQSIESIEPGTITNPTY